MAKRWSESEVTQLQELAGSRSLAELSRLFKTDASAVEAKISELGLVASTRQSLEDDPGLPYLNDGLKPLHAQNWTKAGKLFQKAVEHTDSSLLAERARRYLAICQRKTAEPATEDPYLEAVYEKNGGNLDAALALCKDHGNAAEDERFAYLLASIQALQGDLDQALENLETAIRLEPKNRVHAYHDPDFEALKGREEFSRLLAAPSA